MLEMKVQCERCDSALDPESLAYVCSYECTFCAKCTRKMEGVCPNCSGELLTRPRRGKKAVECNQPAKWSGLLAGQCHCGAVGVEVAGKPETVTECNCSVCRRYGSRWAYYTRETARIRHSEGAISSYAWGDRSIEFFHCKQCGCITHYESMEKTPGSRIAVNARMFEAADTAEITVRYFDGADTWKFLDGA